MVLVIDTIQCVYCLQTKPKPVHGEHIILKGLGGRATIPDVCGGCNQNLGDELDVEVLRHSVIALHRFNDPKVTKGQVGGTQFIDSKFGGFFDSKVYNDQDIDLLPQVSLTERGPLVAANLVQIEQVKAVLRQLKGQDPPYKEIVRDLPENDPPRVVLNLSGKGVHLARGRTKADVARIKEAIKLGVEVQHAVDPADAIEPEFQVRISMELNMVSRCMAKMAFNMATAVFGAQALIRSQFHPVRNYILGDVTVKPLRKDDAGRIHADLDDRFVENWTLGRSSGAVGSTTDHAIELLELDGQLGARVALVGGAECYQLRLGPLDGLDAARLPARLYRTDDDDYWYRGAYPIPNGHLKGAQAAMDAAWNTPKSALKK